MKYKMLAWDADLDRIESELAVEGGSGSSGRGEEWKQRTPADPSGGGSENSHREERLEVPVRVPTAKEVPLAQVLDALEEAITEGLLEARSHIEQYNTRSHTQEDSHIVLQVWISLDPFVRAKNSKYHCNQEYGVRQMGTERTGIRWAKVTVTVEDPVEQTHQELE